MNLKYCYNKEIRKTFTPPATFQELLSDIGNVFETKLPKRFSVQYKDNDQDLITISSDVEYKSMLKFDAPNSLASLKIFIVLNNSPEEKEMSFEVIDSSQLSANAGISEISLSQDPSEHASSRENSPSPKQKKAANSFNGFDTSSNCDMKDQRIQVSNVEPYMNQTFSQLYEAEALILQGLQAEPAEKNDCDQVNHDEEEEQEQHQEEDEEEEELPNETLNQAMASEPSEPDSLYLYTEMQGNARNIENMIFSNEIEKVTQELAARRTPKMLEKLRSPIKQNNYQDSLLNQFLFPHDNFQNMQGTPQDNNMSFERQNQSTDAREMNITSRTQDKFYGNTGEPTDCNRYSRLLNHKRKLWSEELEEINRDYADDFYPNFTKYAEQSNSPKQREWTKFPTQRKIVNCDNYQKPKSPPRYLPPIVQPERQTRASEGYRYMSDLPREKPSYMQDNFYFDRQDRQEPVKMMENQGYEVTPGLSSRLFSIEDSEGMRVVYKTVFIKNTGTKPWTRCFVKPVGLIAGKTVELCNVGVGQTAVVALELRGYFGSRTYTSRWKLVHENQYGMVEVIGGPFDVEFTINSNSVANDRVRMNNMCEQSFEEDAMRFDYGRQEDVMQDGYKYEDFEDADGNRDEEDQEVDQTFARYFRPQEEDEMEDGYGDGDGCVHWFSYQDLRQVKDFTSNVHETSIDEYYLN